MTRSARHCACCRLHCTAIHAGKLFPGPHLFAGAGIVVLWALAAALVPYMQKGNESARNVHIALNVANLALFAWQVCVCVCVWHVWVGCRGVVWCAPADPRGRSCCTAALTHRPCRASVFCLQVPTGLEIVGKVFEFVPWP
jgi:hypothetical protein